MEMGLRGLKAATANNRIYVTGGYNGTMVRDVYLSTMGMTGEIVSWDKLATQLPALSEGRGLYHHGAVVAHGYLWVAGGFDGAIPRNEIWRAWINGDGTLQEFQKLDVTLPEAIFGFGDALLAGESQSYWYIVGGRKEVGGAYVPVDTVYVIPLSATGAGSIIAGWPHLPQLLAYASAAVYAPVGDSPRLYVAGGENDAGPQSAVMSWKLNSVDGRHVPGSFEDESPLPDGGRSLFGMAVSGNNLYVVGGRRGDTYLDSVYRLTLPLPPSPTPTYTATATPTSTPTVSPTESPTPYVAPTPLPYASGKLGVLPLLTKHEPQTPLPLHDSGQGSTTMAVQNVAAQLDLIETHFLGQGGYPELSPAAAPVRDYSSQILLDDELPMLAGWIGSAALDGIYSEPPAGAVRITWNSGLAGVAHLDTTGAAYSSPQSGTELYFPYASVKPVRDASGRHGRFSTLTLMNTGSDTAAYRIDLIGTSIQIPDTLPINESRSYNLADPGDPIGSQLGGDWQGAIKVWSLGTGQPLAGVMTTHWADKTWSQWASAYEGVAEGATTLYAPLIFRKDRSQDPAVKSWISSSNLMVQNLGDADASVRVSWYGGSASTPLFSVDVDITPGQGREFHTRYPQGDDLAGLPETLGDLFQGTAKVESLNGEPLAAVVHNFYHRENENWVTTYVAAQARFGDQYLP